MGRVDDLAVPRNEIRLVLEQRRSGRRAFRWLNAGHVNSGVSPLMELLRRRLTFKNAATVAVEIDPRMFTTEMPKPTKAAEVYPLASTSRGSIRLSKVVCSSRYGTSHLCPALSGPLHRLL